MILVSACLLGEKCKYSGSDNYSPAVVEYVKGREYLACCPELLGGLTVPRSPCERAGDRVLSKEGEDVTAAFLRGAVACADLCRQHHISLAILKEGSPSCGTRRIYDGSFSGRSIPGRGLTAQLLMERGVKVISDEEIGAGC